MKIEQRMYTVNDLRRVVVLLSFLYSTVFSVMAIPVMPVDSMFYGRYPFIHVVDSAADARMVQISDEEFLEKAGKVIFVVNRYDAFVNDSLFRLLEREILPSINRDSLRLVRMVLRGAASPEGSYQNNQMLGRRRAQTMFDFLRERLTVPVDESVFSTDVVSEDYRLLLSMMRSAGDRDVDLVQRLCDRHLPKDEYTLLKNKLKAVHDGALWNRLLKEYFPQLRAARLVLFFEKTREVKEVVPEIPEVPVTLETPEPLVVDEVQEVPETNVVVEAQDSVDTQLVIPEEALPEWLPRREILSVKTNLLFDVAYVPGYDRWCPIPNVAIEFYPLHGHFTVGASFDCPWWQHYWDHKFFQIRNYQVEGRYYFRSGDIRKNPPGEGPAFRGLYLSAYAHLGLFGICFDENHGWEGEGIGAGVGVGYVQRLGKKGHWRLEFAAQVGYLRCGYDPYQYENPVNPNYRDHLYYYKWTGKPELFKERQYRFTWIGPTRVGVTLCYDLLYRRVQKKGVSFRNREKNERMRK